METLGDAVDRLSSAGYRDAFRLEPAGLRALAARRLFSPEELAIDEIVRFEGESDPGDEAVLFALRSKDDGARGTFVATFGPYADPLAGELIKRLATQPHPERAAG